MKRLLLLSLAMLSMATFSLHAKTETPDQLLEKILASDSEPDGVIFEIVTGKDNGLDWALPKTRGYIEKLRKKLPELSIAVVTHGSEQFTLQKKSADKKPKVHQLTQLLVKDNVPVHVCGTYAGWKGLSAEDFPEYVDVAAAGPAQVNDYIRLGYVLIKLDSKSK